MQSKKQKIIQQFRDKFSELIYPSYFGDRDKMRILKQTVTYRQLEAFLKKVL